MASSIVFNGEYNLNNIRIYFCSWRMIYGYVQTRVVKCQGYDEYICVKNWQPRVKSFGAIFQNQGSRPVPDC